jgi:SAM-dependent methyltransferase
VPLVAAWQAEQCLSHLMSFDALAPHYRRMSRLFGGGLMQRSRAAFIAQTRHCRRALLAGEGPGQFLAALLAVNGQVRVTCVEGSARMIEQARAHLARRRLNCGQVSFVQQDALQWSQRPGEFDLVATHYFLDCFRPDQLAGLVPRLADAATPSATWLLADFCVPTDGWRRWRAEFILGLLFRFFRLTTDLAASRLTPPDDYLRAVGFGLVARREWSLGLVHSDLWQRTGA